MQCVTICLIVKKPVTGAKWMEELKYWKLCIQNVVEKNIFSHHITCILTSHWKIHSSKFAVWIWSSVTGSWQSLYEKSEQEQSLLSGSHWYKDSTCETINAQMPWNIKILVGFVKNMYHIEPNIQNCLLKKRLSLPRNKIFESIFLKLNLQFFC